MACTLAAPSRGAFDLIGAEVIREVRSGEIVAIERGGFRVVHYTAPSREARCIFEHVYFSRPDSVIFGQNVAEVRNRFGAQLAREHPVDCRELIASANSPEQIREFIEADSLGYLSEEGMLNCVKNGDDPKRLYCTACFSGRYPVTNEAACEPEVPIRR